MDRPDQTTHFGFRDVPLGDKQTLVNDVFHSVASRYDLMNDLMSAGLHRVWKDIMINALNPPKNDAPFALLDVAGGTGDIAFRAAEAAGLGFHATVCDINTDMLEVGRNRALARHLDHQVSFVEGNAETLAFPDRSFDAYTIAFGIRNVPRIDAALRDAYRVLPPGQLALRLARLIERPGAKSGPRLSRALTRLGPAYLKLGQFLATRPDVVGVAMARDLEALQDRLPPFSQAEAEVVIAQSLERPLAKAFVSFGPAVAAASIAQVHRGETERDGVRKSVAVKVLRPHVASRFRRDLGDFFFVARNAEAHSAEARRLRLIEVINTMSRSVAMEMDLRLEAAALSEMAENTGNDPDFRVPTVDWDRTTHNVLTMEWIDGIALNDHLRLEQSQIDLPELGRKVIQSFLRHALRDGFFHADMHPGNLFLDDSRRLAAVHF